MKIMVYYWCKPGYVLTLTDIYTSNVSTASFFFFFFKAVKGMKAALHLCQEILYNNFIMCLTLGCVSSGCSGVHAFIHAYDVKGVLTRFLHISIFLLEIKALMPRTLKGVLWCLGTYF